MRDETNGSLSSEIFAYIQYMHLKNVLEASQEIKEVIVYSDGCGGQTKNSYLSNMYFVLAQETGVQFTQKERNLVTDIFTPRDQEILMQTARRKPRPYHVKQLKYQDFKKMSTLHFSGIRPWKKNRSSLKTYVGLLFWTVQYKLIMKIRQWLSLFLTASKSTMLLDWSRSQFQSHKGSTWTCKQCKK